MKYFSKELWGELNSIDQKKRASAETKWKENLIRYSAEFERVKPLLPSGFLKEYLSNNGFHDYLILSISIVFSSHVVKLLLSNGYTKGIVELSGVNKYSVRCCGLENCICGNLSWGYSEFNVDHSGRITLSILCDIDNELFFECASIKYVSGDGS